MIDTLPKYICIDCKRRVSTFYDLAILSMETEKKLLQTRDDKINNHGHDHGSVKCPLCGEGKIKSKHKIGNPSVNYLNTKKLLEGRKPIVYNNNNDADEIKKYDICCPALDGTLASDDCQSNKGNKDNYSMGDDDDAHTIVDDEDFICSVCSEKISGVGPHECKSPVRIGGKYGLSKRPRDCIEDVKPEFDDNISEDYSDDGFRPAKQMKFDTHYENW